MKSKVRAAVVRKDRNGSDRWQNIGFGHLDSDRKAIVILNLPHLDVPVQVFLVEDEEEKQKW